MTIRPDTDDLIAFLNSLTAIDPVAMGELMAARVPCNEAMANHPTVQVVAGGADGNVGKHAGESAVPAGEFRVGFLGILNGYAGAFDEGPRKGWGPISAVVEDDGRVTSFRRTQNTVFAKVY